jgi:simple sugar transport system ATP-binding protein
MTALLRAASLERSFGGRLALSGVDLEISEGEVLAVVGENGAGKTTLVNLLSGALAPDRGTLEWLGKPFRPRSPREAAEAGIGVVHQHFALVERFTIAENLALATGAPIWLRPRALERRAAELAARYGLEIGDPSVLVEDLPVGVRQRVEILKALARPTRLLLLDEPTAVLAPAEVEAFLRIVRSLASAGVASLFIAHKLHEVLAVADRVVVLRRGKVVARARSGDTDPAALAREMVGREVPIPSRPLFPAERRPVLEMRGVSTQGGRGARALHGVDLRADAGAIVGIAGVDGNGQRELFEVLLGLLSRSAGSLRIDGREIPPATRSPHLAAIPPDRRSQGLVPSLSVAENLVLDPRHLAAVARGPFLSPLRFERFAHEAISRFSIATPSASSPASALSGGNQQRVVVARALAHDPALLVAAGPTRGLDVAAAAAVHAGIAAFAARGGAVLLISTDLDEVLSLSHEVFVMNGGRSVGPFAPEPAEEARARIGEAMAGAGTHA